MRVPEERPDDAGPVLQLAFALVERDDLAEAKAYTRKRAP
jgi:hypothetical protein